MQDFGEHGREYISPELGLQLLKTLGDPEMIKAVVGGGKRGEELLQLMQRVVFKVRVCVNNWVLAALINCVLFKSHGVQEWVCTHGTVHDIQPS